MNSTSLIIPAAGAGKRLNQNLPKPFIRVAGKTILEHTLLRFAGLQGLRQVLVATSEEFRKDVVTILGQVFPHSVDRIYVPGGEERQHSVYNALQEIENVEFVVVHDAVRPLVSRDVIKKCLAAASDTGSAAVGVRAKDTIKKADDHQTVVETPERDRLWQIQTPQIFRREILLEAYKKAFEDQFIGTDDASLVERLGKEVKIVEGDRNNFKITYPVDLQLAELLLNEEKEDE